MNVKQIIPRELANHDINQAIKYYIEADAKKAALKFVDALEKAYQHISHFPATGFLRYSHELNLPGLRAWPIKKFPHLIFFQEKENHIDVWRVLHSQRDMPKWLTTL